IALLVLASMGCAGGGSDEGPGDVASDAIGEAAHDGGHDAVGDARDAIDGTGDAAETSTDAADAADAAVHRTKEPLVVTAVPSPRAGMFSLVWHAPAATAMRTLASTGGAQLTIEDVIRSDGALHYADIYEKYGVEGDAMALYYNAR